MHKLFDELIIAVFTVRNLPKLVRARWRMRVYKPGIITVGCSGVVLVERVRRDRGIGSQGADFEGRSLIDGKLRHESTDCLDGIISPEVAPYVVMGMMGLGYDEACKHILKLAPELMES